MDYTSFAQMLASFAFEALSATLFYSDLRSGRRVLDGISILVVFLCIQSLHIIAAGLCGWLSGFWMTASSMAGIVAFAAVSTLRARVMECFRLFVAPSLRNLADGARRNPFLAVCAAGAAAYIAFHALLFVVIAPPLTFDALTYHLSKVAHWVHSGSLALPVFPIKRVFWPSGMELLNCWWAVFRHDDFLIEMPGLYFHALATLATYAIARNMGIRKRASAYAAIAFSITPVIVGHGSTCLTDLPTAALFYFLLAFWTVPSTGEEDARRRWFLSAMALFLAIGIKPTIAFMMPGLLVAAMPLVRRHDFVALKSVFRASPSLWILVCASLFLGSFWYLRNAIRFGNPLYPVVAG